MATLPTWQLLPDPITDDVYSPIDAAISEFERGTSAIQGRGLIRPFRRGGNGDFVSGTGIDLLRSALALVLNTTCSSPTTFGELPWRTEFGSLLQRLRQRNNNANLRQFAETYVARAVVRWIPSLRISNVDILSRDNTLIIRIVTDVMDPTGTRVLVPGLETAVPLG